MLAFNLKVGDVVDNVKLLKEIKRGAFGVVFFAEDQTDKTQSAVKIVKFKKETRNDVEKEILIGMKVSKSCPFLVGLKKVNWKDDECCIGMEYCDGGDLRDEIQRRIASKTPFTRKELLQFVFHSCSALDALHRLHIIHRDLKPENFLLSAGVYKLADFGIAKVLDNNPLQTMTSNVGTQGYASLEIMEGRLAYNSKTDIFSLGIVILELFDLKHPYSNDNGTLNMIRYMQGKVNPIKSTACPELLTVARRMILPDPQARPSVADVLHQTCVHEFLGTLCVDAAALSLRAASAEKRISLLRQQNAKLAQEITGLQRQGAGQSQTAALQQQNAKQAEEITALQRENASLRDTKSMVDIHSSAAAAAGVAASTGAPAIAPLPFAKLFSATYKADSVVLSDDRRSAWCVHASTPEEDKKVSIAVLVGDGKVGDTDGSAGGGGIISLQLKLERPDSDYAV